MQIFECRFGAKLAFRCKLFRTKLNLQFLGARIHIFLVLHVHTQCSWKCNFFGIQMQNFWNLKFLRTPTCIYSEVFHSNFNFDEYIYIYIYVHMRMLTNYKCTVSVYVALQPHSNSSNVNYSHDGSRYICCVVYAVLCCTCAVL